MSFFGIGQKIEKVIGKEQELLDASRNGNVEAVEKLLANRSKKSTKSTTGGAIGHKLTSFLKNINVNYTDKNGYTALHHAAVNGYRDVVESLLKADAQPGLVDNQGCTAVHLAAWNGNAEIVMQLLMAGSSASEPESTPVVTPVNVNHQNGNGDTALHCAAQYGNVPVVDVLLQKNANPTIRNLNEESALDLAAQYGRLEVVQLLLISFPELSQRPACTQSPLHLASRNGHKDIVDVLLKNNFAVQTVTETGSALHEAALHGKLEVVRILLDNNIDVSLCDREGRTALELLSAHQAQQKSFTEITQAIKDHVIKSNEGDQEVYDRLSNYSSGEKPMATVRPLTPDKPVVTDKHVIKTPDKASPTLVVSRINPSPSLETPPTPPYSKPNKDKLFNHERVVSTASSTGDLRLPPPLPPRISVYQPDDRGPENIAGKGSGSPTTEGSPSTTPKAMVVPKKPPRQKKSPATVRRSMIQPNPPSPDSPVSFFPPTTIDHIPVIPQNIPNVSVSLNGSSQHSTLKLNQSDEKDNSTHNSMGPTNQSDSSAILSVQPEVKHKPPGIPIVSVKPDVKDKPADNPIVSVKPDVKDKPAANPIVSGQQEGSPIVLVKPEVEHKSPDKPIVSNKPEVKHKPQISPKPALPPKSASVKLNMSTAKDIASTSKDMIGTVKDHAGTTKDNCDAGKDNSVTVKDNSVPVTADSLLVKVDNSAPLVTGSQEGQVVYMEMKPKSRPSPIQTLDPVKTEHDLNTIVAVDTQLKPAEIKEDNYGILFPNLKNSSPSKTPKITRANTAPEENVYVGHFPTSPAEKFKEKQGILRRTNTAPEEQTYTSMAGPTLLESNDPTRENEYAEIPEKMVVAPVSPTENIYATIPEVKKEMEASVYLRISDMSSKPSVKEKDVTGGNSSSKPTVDEKNIKGGNSSSKPTVDEKNIKGGNSSSKLSIKEKDVKGGNSKENKPVDQQDVPKLPDRNGAETKVHAKPTYLDFMKKLPTQPLTPTGYPQPPTPDFPPPSPATAMLGIELKIQEMDSKRKSRDMTTLTDELLEQIPEQNQEASQTHSSEVKVTQGIFRSELNIKSERLSREVIEEEGDSENLQKVNETTSNQSSAFKQKVNKVSENSVIQSEQTKDIPKSSIPSLSVIEDSSANMADNQSANQKPEEKAGNTLSANEATADSPVMMRRKSSSSTPDMDVFKGLLRGSTIGASRKGLSLIYDEVRKSSGRQTVPSSYLTIDTMMEDDGIDVDQVMKSIDKEVAKRASAHDSSVFDDSEEWAQIADIMSSFGGDLSASFQYSASEEEKINSELESYMDNLLSESSRGSMQSVGEWLESLGLGQYENTFVANGYDNVDYLDNKILEEQDLEQIGVLTHEHRRQILLSAKSLPQLQPIESTNPPSSLEEWLMSLQLLDYLETFKSHGYDTMEKVESILWELQLRTVLDISQLGHRKRILASLGERHPPDRQTNSLKKKSVSPYSQEESKKPFSDINLFRDYTNVKPTSSSEEDVKETTQMAVDSSEDEESILKKRGGQSIRNSNIHLRPPHLAQTTSPARQWRHKPEMLIKGCCNYTAQYLGSTVVPDLTGGTESTREGITKLKRKFMQQLQKSTDVLAKIPVIMLSISFKGVKFIDAKSKKVICEHDIGNIFCACQDTENLNFFAYITRDIETGKHYCHVFSVKSSSLAHDIILTLGESFEVAYQMALKEKSMKEAMELDRKMSQSDNEVYSQSSKISTNTL